MEKIPKYTTLTKQFHIQSKKRVETGQHSHITGRGVLSSNNDLFFKVCVCLFVEESISAAMYMYHYSAVNIN